MFTVPQKTEKKKNIFPRTPSCRKSYHNSETLYSMVRHGSHMKFSLTAEIATANEIGVLSIAWGRISDSGEVKSKPAREATRRPVYDYYTRGRVSIRLGRYKRKSGVFRSIGKVEKNLRKPLFPSVDFSAG